MDLTWRGTIAFGVLFLSVLHFCEAKAQDRSADTDVRSETSALRDDVAKLKAQQAEILDYLAQL